METQRLKRMSNKAYYILIINEVCKMANNFEYVELFMDGLDEQMAQESVTGWLEANAGQVIYNGGKEVKIPKMSTSGLGDYSRETGYAQGSVSLSYETRKLTQDRGRKFSIDSMDVNESNFVANVTNVMGTFQKTQVLPEIDKLCVA